MDSAPRLYCPKTHSLVIFARFGQQTRAAIIEPDQEVLVSVASLWEVRGKESLGKLELPDGFRAAIAEQGFRELAVRGKHTDELIRLPMHQRDPFDRLRIAQARCDTLTLVTSDERIQMYDTAVLEAGR